MLSGAPAKLAHHPGTLRSVDDAAIHERRSDVPIAIALVLSLLLYANVRAPVPAVNEPYYLTKARHFIDPGWLKRDFYLASTDVHCVFFGVAGSLTQWLSFEQTTWLLRTAAWALLSVGWLSLARHLPVGRFGPVTALWLFLLMGVVGNFSGEWIVGGVEGKVFAYGLVFLSMSSVVGQRWLAAGLFGGIAVSCHPVVGCWHLVALVCASSLLPSGRPKSPRDRYGAVCLFAVSSLPGLIPAVQLIPWVTGADGTGSAAEQIQVYDRLAHHLDPTSIRPFAWVWYGLMSCVLMFVRRGTSRSKAEEWLFRYCLATTGIAAMGIVVGTTDIVPLVTGGAVTSAKLLKFYPSRLFDVMLPLLTAMTLTCRLNATYSSPPSEARPSRVRPHIVIAPVLVSTLWLSSQASDRQPGYRQPDLRAA